MRPEPNSPFWRLLHLTGPLAGWMALAALLGLATIASNLGLMATSAYIIAKAALHPSIVELQLAIVGVRFFGISRGLARYLERYISHQVTFRLLARLRVWFYQRLEPLAPARLMPYRSADLLSRIGADIDTLEHFYVRVIAPPVVAGLVSLCLGLLLGSFDPQLAVIGLLFLALAGVGLPLLVRRLSRGLGQRQVTIRAELNTALVDSLQGLGDLLACGQEQPQVERVGRLSRALVEVQERLAQLTGLHSALSSLLASLATLAILLATIPLVSHGQIDGVYLALLVLVVLASFEAVIPLPAAFQHLESSTAAAARLFELIDAQPAVEERANPAFAPLALTPTPLPEGEGLSTAPLPLGGVGGGSNIELKPALQPQDYSLRVDHLTFSYQPDEPPALAGLSFYLPEGGRLALVGPSGAGKTTLVNLLLRFWEYQAGHIYLGGYELRAYAPDHVRRLIGVVSQHTHLFNTTVRENLLLARPEASPAELIQAARQAHIHDFIESLPQGYDTWLGEQGLCLSGGERQRLAIARAILKNAPLLILDEATANLDALVEREVMQSLHALMTGRTCLIISHRPAGLALADEILVLQAGRVVERGRPVDLLPALML